MRPWFAAAACAALLLVCGCRAPQPRPVGGAEPPAPASEALLRASRAATPEARADILLQALQARHDAGDERGADQIAAQLAPQRARLTPTQRFRLDAVAMERALRAGDRARIVRLAEALAPANAPQRRRADGLRAQALAHAEDHAQAALALLEIIERLDGHAPSASLSRHAAAAWRHLSKLPLPALARLAEEAPAPSAKRWLEAALEFNGALTGSRQAAVWRRWREAHPDHVAARHPPRGILLGAGGPGEVALLLPLSGELASLAAAIRDGFLAAYLHAADGAESAPPVRLYDTGAMAAVDAYRSALREGADVLVGPLDKAAVAALAALPPARPVVALNTVDDVAATADLVQLALAPEHEAEAIAAALSAAGAERVVVFDNALPWSARAEARLRAAASARVVGVATLSSGANATQVAASALRVAESQARHAALAGLLGASLEFTPRRRDDVDAIVAFVDGAQLMALKPALDFHYAGDLPLYAPSQATGGVNWGRLDGLRVCTIPWRLHDEPLRRASKRLANSQGPLASLFALGVDAFRVANQLTRMTARGESIAGSTGVLTLAENGRIGREPAWGRVSRGRLVPLEPR